MKDGPEGDSIAEITTREVLTAARTLGIEVHVLNANVPRDVEVAFTKAVEPNTLIGRADEVIE